MKDVLSQEISLKQLDLIKIAVPQVESFQSAIGARKERIALLVRWIDVDENWGIGECSCRPDPFFSGEFVDGAMTVIRDYLLPRLPQHGTLADVVEVVAKIRGWNFTVAAVLDAAFDLLRRTGHDDPIAAWPEESISHVPAGISLGLFPTADAAIARIQNAQNDGYHRIKLKVTPTMDLSILEAIREAYPTLPLCFDANGSCNEQHVDFLKSLARFQPSLIEQPFSPRRLDLYPAFRNDLNMRVCLDESLTSLGDVIIANRTGALDEVNLKPGRVGGMLETLRILHYCKEYEIPCWVGGMFETGIGRLANLRVAALLPKAKAHDLSPSNRYFSRDIVANPITMNHEGYIIFEDDGPVEVDEQAIDAFLVEHVPLPKVT